MLPQSRPAVVWSVFRAACVIGYASAGELCVLMRLLGLGWAGGSHYESGMSSSLPLEPELAPCGWHWPHRRLTLMRPFGNGNGGMCALWKP
jgi:hypothetical protein